MLQGKIGKGMELTDLDDLIERDQLAGADSLEANEALNEHIQELERSATGGGTLLTNGDLIVLRQLAASAFELARAAHSAALNVAAARLGGVR